MLYVTVTLQTLSQLVIRSVCRHECYIDCTKIFPATICSNRQQSTDFLAVNSWSETISTDRYLASINREGRTRPNTNHQTAGSNWLTHTHTHCTWRHFLLKEGREKMQLNEPASRTALVRLHRPRFILIIIPHRLKAELKRCWTHPRRLRPVSWWQETESWLVTRWPDQIIAAQPFVCLRGTCFQQLLNPKGQPPPYLCPHVTVHVQPQKSGKVVSPLGAAKMQDLHLQNVVGAKYFFRGCKRAFCSQNFTFVGTKMGWNICSDRINVSQFCSDKINFAATESKWVSFAETKSTLQRQVS